MSGPTTGEAGGCFLCAAARSTDDAQSLVVARRAHGFVVLNRYPYNSGHVMVVPARHVADLGELDAQERLGIMNLLVETLDVLKAEMAPDGANIGINLGQAGGAGVPGHLHVHCVPRWTGDTNFMPVLSGSMVLPESLEATWDRLTRRFAAAAEQTPHAPGPAQ